ncbi:MAG TPA: phenazine biosynthesis protein PhzF [Micromonosporaceae bacterium]|nr:phenazine biosynthesis protein PhzF [Micromonosporaceae bacterium]
MTTEVLRYTAFARDPKAGNPAGIVIDTEGLAEPAMQAIAAQVGYSETAFLRPLGGGQFAVRYFSPQAEVPFCGHATVASAVAIAERDGVGTLHFGTQVGRIVVQTGLHDGGLTATLTSVPTRVATVTDADLEEALAALDWPAADLDPDLPPRIAFGGAHHLVLAARSRERLADLDYDFDRLKTLMLQREWTTIQLVWRESPTEFHVRNPFPVGGIVEDPATGAAAAAFGGYLRSLGLITPPATIRLHQGADMGRPSLLVVEVPAGVETVKVTGNAVRIEEL